MPAQPTVMPDGSKLWLLNLGFMDIDNGAILMGSNVFAPHLPPQKHDRRELVMIAALILHPDAGLILFDTGCCEDRNASWDKTITECSPMVWEKEVHGLPEAIKATGNDIKDVKTVVMSHLHLDHAGGLEHFLDRLDVEIWLHEEEFKNAFWAHATGIDSKAYLKDYLTVSRLNWKTFSTPAFTLFQGITLHLTPGHTEGSCIMEVELPISGTIILTADLFHVKENWEQGRPQGSFMRDYNSWFRSRQYVQSLMRKTQGRIVLGHDYEIFKTFPESPAFMA